MNKQEIKNKTKKEMRKIMNDIYISCCNYLIGNKYTGSYVIDAGKKSTQANTIRVDCGYGLPVVYIYFSCQIRIAIRWNQYGIDNYWTYFGEEYTLPEDIALYILKTKTFLCELIRHANAMEPYIECYPKAGATDFDLSICPEQFKDYAGNLISLLKYQYMWQDNEVIDYVIDMMKSKPFKRARGDCK